VGTKRDVVADRSTCRQPIAGVAASGSGVKHQASSVEVGFGGLKTWRGSPVGGEFPWSRQLSGAEGVPVVEGLDPVRQS